MQINHSLTHLDVARIEHEALLKQMDARRLARANDTRQPGGAGNGNPLRALVASFGAVLAPRSARSAGGQDVLLPYTR